MGKKNECENCGAEINNGNAVIMTLAGSVRLVEGKVVNRKIKICKECFAEWNMQNNDIDILLKQARETGDFKTIENIYKAL
ncbi:MAG: hypothetical protein DRI95_00725 [Bacteroidetes bacterium]|nr:MAG: hypothetical protein DRI95_00725 [Bacteroidota bacterium]